VPLLFFSFYKTPFGLEHFVAALSFTIGCRPQTWELGWYLEEVSEETGKKRKEEKKHWGDVDFGPEMIGGMY